MADNKPGIKSTLAGWIKAGITSIIGLLSGAFLMYLTPLINNTIKPARPVANFATQISGLTVAFNNHSTGGGQGWWDFGDGTELVPFTPKDSVTTHTYAKPGTYNVKLSLQSIFGEESERSVAINVDGATASNVPVVEKFEVTPVADDRVPATYEIDTKIQNAAFCILVRGDDRPLQLDVDGMNQKRYVAFDKPGTYLLRLAAINGKELVEKTKTITVRASEPGEALAKLRVIYEAVKIKREQRQIPVQIVWNRDPKETVCPFREERPVNPGYVITAVELAKDDKSAPVQKVKLEVAPDKTRVILTGELLKPRTWLPGKVATPSWQANIKVTMERRSPPMIVDRGEVQMALRMNTMMKLPMQPLDEGWEVLKQKVNIELMDGSRKVFETAQAVTGAKVMLKNQPCTVTVSPQKNVVLLKVDGPAGSTTVAAPAPMPPTPSVVQPVRFDRLPGLPRPK